VILDPQNVLGSVTWVAQVAYNFHGQPNLWYSFYNDCADARFWLTVLVIIFFCGIIDVILKYATHNYNDFFRQPLVANIMKFGLRLQVPRSLLLHRHPPRTFPPSGAVYGHAPSWSHSRRLPVSIDPLLLGGQVQRKKSLGAYPQTSEQWALFEKHGDILDHTVRRRAREPREVAVSIGGGLIRGVRCAGLCENWVCNKPSAKTRDLLQGAQRVGADPPRQRP
jgi:hypothetical protein